MRVSANDPCPCGRDAKLKRCCGAIHGGRPPADPETLMRARYVAYATANARFLIETTHPDAPHFREDRSAWRTELLAYCRETRFLGLTVHAAEFDDATDYGFVTFTAELERNGVRADFTERSRFERVGKRWKYVSGEIDDV